MTLDSLIMLVGTFVAIVPFLGLPNAWDSYLYFILGVCTIALGIVVRRRYTGRRNIDRVASSFVENEPARTPARAEGNDHAES